MNKYIALVLPISTLAVASTETQKLMNDIYYSYTALLRYSSSNFKFFDKKNENIIKLNINSLNKKFKVAHKEDILTDTSYKSNLKAIRENLDEVYSSFSTGHKNFAYGRLKATKSLCISCHSQLPENQSSRMNKVASSFSKDSFRNDFEHAQFLFLLRKYDKSLKKFKAIISNHAMDPSFEKTVDVSLKRIAHIYLHVLHDIKSLRAYLSGVGVLPTKFKELVNDWKKQLADLNESTALKELEKKWEKDELTVMASLDLSLMYVSGILKKKLSHAEEKNQVAKDLFWIALNERQLNKNDFYDLANLYLKDCIENYSDTPYAKKCYAQYEQYVQFSYTGSMGTDLPIDITQKLNFYRKLLEIK